MKAFMEVEFIKQSMTHVVREICPEKKSALENISLLTRIVK